MQAVRLDGRLFGGGEGVGECCAGASLWLLGTQVAPCSCFRRRKVRVGPSYWLLAAFLFGSARRANTQRTDDVRGQTQLVLAPSGVCSRWAAERALMLHCDLWRGEPFNGCALPARDAALSLCLGARWAAIKPDAPLNSATLPRNVDEASQVPKQSPLGSSSRRRYSGARFERLGNRLMRSSTPPCPHD